MGVEPSVPELRSQGVSDPVLGEGEKTVLFIICHCPDRVSGAAQLQSETGIFAGPGCMALTTQGQNKGAE